MASDLKRAARAGGLREWGGDGGGSGVIWQLAGSGGVHARDPGWDEILMMGVGRCIRRR